MSSIGGADARGRAWRTLGIAGRAVGNAATGGDGVYGLGTGPGTIGTGWEKQRSRGAGMGRSRQGAE